MVKKNIGIILLLIFCLLPIHKIYAQVSNVGFVPENIWYSTDPFAEGDKVKIYTLIFNPDSRELSGTVVFYDDSVLLGKKDFNVSTGGVKDIYINWTATVGIHNIFGKIENAKFLISNGEYEKVSLAENETSKSSRTVNKKIIIKTPDLTQGVNAMINNTAAVGLESTQNIRKIIGENTPDFIAKPLVLGASTVENFRQNIGVASENKKEEIQSQIKVLDLNKKNNTNYFLKPFKYIELFFFTFLSFILNTQFIFYFSLAVIVFLILRFIGHLFFF